MYDIRMDDIIAERGLMFRETGAELDQAVTVRFRRPYLGEQAPNYTIHYDIEGPGDNRYTSLRRWRGFHASAGARVRGAHRAPG